MGRLLHVRLNAAFSVTDSYQSEEETLLLEADFSFKTLFFQEKGFLNVNNVQSCFVTKYKTT